MQRDASIDNIRELCIEYKQGQTVHKLQIATFCDIYIPLAYIYIFYIYKNQIFFFIYIYISH